MSTQGKYAAPKKDPLRKFLPIIGLIIMAIAGAVGYFSAPFILTYAQPYIPPEVTAGLDQQSLELVITVAIFVIIVGLFSTVYAAFAPKQEKLVTESALKAERKSRADDERRAKLRKRKMRARMKDGNKGLDDI